MGKGEIIERDKADGWKAWAAGLAGAALAFSIAVISGAGADQVFLRPGQDVGFAIGYGGGIGLLVWLALNFTALRGQGSGKRALVFGLAVLGGALGVMQNL